MRILFIFDHLDTGGAQTHGLGLARELMHAGHTVAVASRGGDTSSRFARQGAVLLDWPNPKRTDFFGLIRSYRRAQHVLRTWQPDLIHAHAVLPGVLFSIAARHLSGHRIPIVFTPHRSWRSMYPRRFHAPFIWLGYHVVWRQADYVIAVAKGYYEEFIRYGVSPSRCFEIPNGVDVSAYDGVLAPGPSSALTPSRVVGTVGRLVTQKGLDVFLDAAALVAARSTDTEFWIVGAGTLQEELLKQTTSLGLDGRVHLLGNRTDVPVLLQQMSIFVSASRWEAVCFAILEALAARRPVVATQILGSTELIQDGITGLLVPPDDPIALSTAILRLLDDRAYADQLAEAGRHLVEQVYNQRRMAEQVMQLYQQAIAGRAT